VINSDRNEQGVPGPRLGTVEPVFDTFDLGDIEDVPGATHWPDIPAADVPDRWDELRGWVEQLQARFVHLDHHVIPRCWWRHNEHVEALSALRDHELVSFAESAPATAPVDWFRALRDVSALLRSWTGELSCGADHKDPPPPPSSPTGAEWVAFVKADLAKRVARVEGQRGHPVPSRRLTASPAA
jgi:hypothetical protein